MTGDFDDELSRRLTGLSADLDGVSLAGPSAARARAARRTRHQVTGGVLAGVAAVAAGVAIISPPDLTTTPDPAPPASLSTTAPTDPATTTTAPAVSAALLTPEDVAGDSQVGWARADEPGPEVACDPAGVLDTMSSVLDRAQVAYASEGGEVRQDLVRFADGSTATGLADELFGCLPARGADELPWVSDTLRLAGVGDEGWLARYYADPEDPQADVATVAIVRSRDVVSVTVETRTTADTAADRGELDLAVPVAAASRMCDTLFGDTCVTDPATEDITGLDPTDAPTDGPTEGPADDPSDPADPTEPDEPDDEPATELLDLADDPMLTADDLAVVGARTGFVRRPEMDMDGAYAPCLQDPSASGAETVVTLGYDDELDATLIEWVLLMPDTGTAAGMVESHTVLPEACGEAGEDRVQTVGEPVVLEVDGADDAVVWSVLNEPGPDDPGSEWTTANVGIARVGNVVVAVSFSSMGDPADGDWPGVATGLLATALERAVG